jgi:hypothetical protein
MNAGFVIGAGEDGSWSTRTMFAGGEPAGLPLVSVIVHLRPSIPSAAAVPTPLLVDVIG